MKTDDLPKQRLRTLLNEWDPLGVLPSKGGPQDEYDCLIAPLKNLLSHGRNKRQLIVHLTKSLETHFNLPPQRNNLEKFVDKLIDEFPL